MSKFEKFLFSLMLALLVAGVTLVIVQAKAETPAPSQQTLNCGNCHQETQMAWFSGAHGNASQDSLFTQAWSEQGQPGACLVCHVTGYDPASGTWKQDGVSCEACHSPVNINHPEEPMPIKDPVELCGQCHSEARFGWQEWQSSTHYQRNMTCTVCHDPHTASLKTVAGTDDESPSALCINCHRQYSMNFSYSIHKQAGVNCIDCHLQHFGEQGDRAIHTMPDHSFTANLNSCNTCHATQMHTASDGNAADLAPVEISNTETISEEQVSNQPSPLSPYGYAGLAGLLGLAGGMVLSPWLDKAYRRLTKEGRKQ
jgi:predicted CXXCH cytochrome family protein